jgi:hypothetical protein
MILNILVAINMYWYFFAALFVPATYYIFLKIFTFPLITRKAHDFVLVASPESIHIRKITSRIAPFFNFKRNLYWFSESSEDDSSLNRYLIFVEGINQPITEVNRNQNKVHDVTHTYKLPRQVSGHKIIIPIRLKEHLNRHFKLIVNAETGKTRLEPTSQRQPLRVSFFHTMGVLIESVQKVENEIELGSSSGKTVQVHLTSQLMMQQLKTTSETSNFSSSYAYESWRSCIDAQHAITGNLSGAMDPKTIMLLLALMGVGAGIFFAFYYSDPRHILGAMPT